MMGSNEKPQNQLFYSFNLDEIVPEDHLLRHIDRLLDLSDLRQHLTAASMGQRNMRAGVRADRGKCRGCGPAGRV